QLVGGDVRPAHLEAVVVERITAGRLARVALGFAAEERASPGLAVVLTHAFVATVTGRDALSRLTGRGEIGAAVGVDAADPGARPQARLGAVAGIAAVGGIHHVAGLTLAARGGRFGVATPFGRPRRRRVLDADVLARKVTRPG